MLFEHDTAVVAASLGVLKAGKCYLPLDPVSPAARTTYLLADSRARLIVTGARCHLAGELGGGCLDLLDVERLPSEAGVETLGAGAMRSEWTTTFSSWAGIPCAP